jgi:O-antigen ligase
MLKKINLQSVLSAGLYTLLFIIPWQTILILHEPFVNGSKWEFGVLGFYATELLLWVCAILFIFWYRKKWLQVSGLKFKITKDRLFVVSCSLFVVYCLLSSFWAINPELAWQHGLRVMGAFILFFMLWLGPITFRKATSWFVAGATIQSLLGIWQFLTQSTFAFKWLGLVEHPVYQAGTSIISSPEIGRWLRAYGAFSHPNVLGGFLVVSIILTILLTSKYKISKFSIFSFQFSLILQTVALFFTYSRSAWLAILISLIGLLVYWFISKRFTIYDLRFTIYTLLTFAILTTIFFLLVQTRFSNTSYNETVSISERLYGYSESLTVTNKNLLFGVGAGNYTVALIELNPYKPGWSYQPTHNVLLLILTELGLVGKLLLSIVILTFLILLRSQKILFKPEIYLLFTVYCLLIIFDHYMYSSFTGLLIAESFFGLILLHQKSSLS